MSIDLISNRDAPADLADRIASLSDAKRALLELRFGKQVARPMPEDRIPRLVTRDALPLSFAQQRLWFLDQLQPNGIAYNETIAFRLGGDLNLTALQKALDGVVARHEILRTTYSMLDDIPVQVISAERPCEWVVTDLSSIPAPERDLQAQHLLKREARRHFNLSSDLMLRAAILKLDSAENILLLVMHHIAVDGWSVAVLCRELAALYEAYSKDRSPTLPELPIHYSDFAAWQRKHFEGKRLATDLAYWKDHLNGAPWSLELPTDRPQPAALTYEGAIQSFVIPRALSGQLKALRRKERVTFFMTLLAAFQTLLCRYSSQDDIVVGSPVAGRRHEETKGLIGCFINNLVFRTDLSGDPTFTEVIARVRDVALGAYEHQDLPFEKLVEELRPERDRTRNPLFQVMFVLQSRVPLELTGLTVTPVVVNNQTAKFDLTLSMVEESGSLEGFFEYNTDLFDPATVKRMSDHFQILLERIVANPDQRLSELLMLGEAEREQLLVGWNATRAEYPRCCVHELFEAQVQRTPDAVAVVFEDQQLTYRELNVRANQLAHYLRKLVVKPGVVVGIYMERSVEMITAILSIQKAGGTYLPLDAAYPKERIAFMLDDARAPVLLTQQRLIEDRKNGGPRFSIPALSEVEGLDSQIKVICLDCEWEVVARESKENPRADVTAENLAYVIYTSGSTGRPKGVEITHGSLVNFTLSTCDVLALSDKDRILQFASISFDTAVEEIFPCLIRGATLVLRTDSVLESASMFLQKCRDWQITVLDLPTVYWHELTEKLGSELLPEQLRLVIIGGEKALSERLSKWNKVVGNHIRLVNTYGPTEATVAATMWELGGPAQADWTTREVPIGRPIANVQTYILDKHFNPVPIGVSGELHIGGVGLARGYLSRPELTADKFIPNPFSDKPGERLYRTGDFARYLADGTIEFLDRIDHQVKIRGSRIELGEIETVLSQHPAVKETVVLAREEVENPKSETCTEPSRSIQNPKSAKRLVAYVVPRQEGTPAINELRSFLNEKLPEYMVPSAFVFLDRLPLTANGKIDRRGLPAPDQSRPALKESFVAPRTPIEELLAEIWAAVLKLDTVGVHDNFFDLGGHSLLATQVMSRIGQAFKVELPLRALFESPTVAGLVERIEEIRREEHGMQLYLLLSVSREKDSATFLCPAAVMVFRSV